MSDRKFAINCNLLHPWLYRDSYLFDGDGQAFHRIKQRASARSTAAPCLPTLRHSPP